MVYKRKFVKFKKQFRRWNRCPCGCWASLRLFSSGKIKVVVQLRGW